MSDNWVVQNLENALEVWNGKLRNKLGQVVDNGEGVAASGGGGKGRHGAAAHQGHGRHQRGQTRKDGSAPKRRCFACQIIG